MQISTLLRPKLCLRRHIESTSRNEFKQFSSNEDFRILRIQDGDEENRAARRKLGAN